MAQLRIRVGAVLDRSFDVVFANAEARGKRAAQNISRAFNQELRKIGQGGIGSGAGGGFGGGRTRDPAAQAAIDARRREAQERIRAVRDAARLEHSQELFLHRERLRSIRTEERAKLAALTRARREQERNARAELRDFAQRTSHRTTRFLTPNAPIGSMAARGLSDVARGLGVDFSVAGAVSRNVELESMATRVSNSGFLPGSGGRNAQRVDPRTLVAEARAVTERYGVDTVQALDALQGFAGVAGDLALGRSLLMEMARLSAATGTNLGDMAQASANVSQQLGDVPNKGEIIARIMKVIAAQGKLGAVEISDLASQMARVAASANYYEGGAEQNVKFFGALTQLARQKGGAPSAAEAARSAQAFTDTFKKAARISAFRKQGVELYTEESGGTELKNPQRIIEESLLATGGNIEKLNKLYMDKVGARAIAGLAVTFNQAGGGESGIQAVRKELDPLFNAKVSEKEINDSAAAAGMTAESKANRFQAKLDDVTREVMNDLLPALERVSPELIKFAQTVGNVSTWAIENPKQAIGAAIIASIARAGVESALRTGVERAIMGAGSVGGTGGSSALAKVSAGITLASIAVTTFYVGKAIIDNMVDNTKRDAEEQLGKNLTAEEELKRLTDKSAAQGGLSKDEFARAAELGKGIAGRLGVAEVRNENSPIAQGIADFFGSLLGNEKEVAAGIADAGQVEELRDTMNSVLETLRRGIRINNLSEIPANGSNPASPGGTQAPPLPGP